MTLGKQEPVTNVNAREIAARLFEEARVLSRQAKCDYSLELGSWDDGFTANEEGF